VLPLNPILGWVQLLLHRKLDQPTTQRALEIIERNAKLQTQLIDDLLDVSRILRDKLVLNTAAIHLIPIIEDALETVQSAADSKEVQIQTQLNSSPLANFGRCQPPEASDLELAI
jgi:signal transduction histidine kinase